VVFIHCPFKPESSTGLFERTQRNYYLLINAMIEVIFGGRNSLEPIHSVRLLPCMIRWTRIESNRTNRIVRPLSVVVDSQVYRSLRSTILGPLAGAMPVPCWLPRRSTFQDLARRASSRATSLSRAWAWTSASARISDVTVIHFRCCFQDLLGWSGSREPGSLLSKRCGWCCIAGRVLGIRFFAHSAH
jgi:hypothetical protein